MADASLFCFAGRQGVHRQSSYSSHHPRVPSHLVLISTAATARSFPCYKKKQNSLSPPVALMVSVLHGTRPTFQMLNQLTDGG